MAAVTASRRSRKPYRVQKPNGQLTPRVQAVGPEHFGILAVDCAKHRSRYFLADFYGRVLLAPTTVEHDRDSLAGVIAAVRQARRQHNLGDLVVAIERTGEYHRPLQRAFRNAGLETRLVHPFTSKQYRQPADPGCKTDDTDLAAIFRAATQGFGLLEPEWPELYVRLQLLQRHRRDLVHKCARLQCQIREVLNAALPGFEKCFTHLWQSPAALTIARELTSAADILQAGYDGLKARVLAAGVQARPDSLHKILQWARQAPPAHPLVAIQRGILVSRDDDRLEKSRQIEALEVELASLAVQTPYALLLALPGINLVTVADLAGELGPVEFYTGSERITGRAGLMPTRYQSDRVDHADGPLVRRANRRLRAVLMQTASNLVHCNHYYQARARLWQLQHKDECWIRVKVAKAFSRLLFAIVAGRQLFPHPALQPGTYLSGKLLAFHAEHQVAPAQMRGDLEALHRQLPAKARAAEVPPLQERLNELKRRRGPQPLADILAVVLARLQVIESPPGEDPS